MIMDKFVLMVNKTTMMTTSTDAQLKTVQKNLNPPILIPATIIQKMANPIKFLVGGQTVKNVQIDPHKL